MRPLRHEKFIGRENAVQTQSINGRRASLFYQEMMGVPEAADKPLHRVSQKFISNMRSGKAVSSEIALFGDNIM